MPLALPARTAAILSALCCAAAASAQQPARAPQTLIVAFSQCTEFVGLTPIALAGVQDQVPAGFTPASFGSGLTGAVARVTDCAGIAVDGAPAQPARVSHIGVNLVSPDGTGDISNYTLVYVTNHARLAQRLRSMGLPASYDPAMSYEVTTSAAGQTLFSAVTPEPGNPYFFHGGVSDPAAGSEFPFLANWWFVSRKGKLRMSTTFPAIGFGASDAALYTAQSGEIGTLLGGSRTVFPALSVRGRYDSATMTVTLSR